MKQSSIKRQSRVNLETRKLLTACVAIAAGAVLLIAILVIPMAQSDNPTANTASDITIKGTFDCLPNKEGVHTLMCQVGLRAENGQHYILKYDRPLSGSEDFNTPVRVHGILTPPAPDDIYITAGTITVKLIER